MNRVLRILLILFFSSLYSCSSYKNIPYFQNIDRTSITTEEISNYTKLTVQPDDIIGINVTSLNAEASSIFNYNLLRIGGNFGGVGGQPNPVIGYMVDVNGFIQVPLIGSMKVAGLTTAEISEELRVQLLSYLGEPTVNIRILNYRVSVLGDVGRPGTFPLIHERVAIPEALSLAGDLNITGIRNNILLIREINGERIFIPIDLTSRDIFDSPYYYLKNNDVLYIQPDRSKFASADRRYRNAGLFLSIISIATLLFNNFITL